MADAHFGGGGSVNWELRVDDDEREDPDKRTTHMERARRGCTCRGVDKVIHGTHFVVSVKVPEITNRHDFIQWLLGDGELKVRNRTARFRLPIQKDPNQISVRWK
jgi:hypothetical protein